MEARATLIVHYSPWAKTLARNIFMRVRGRSQDWPDFVQNASIGLMEAVASYDPHRGVPFISFAQRRVRGAVFNGLRHIFDNQDSSRCNEAATQERVTSLLEESGFTDPVEQLIATVAGLGVGYLVERGGIEFLNSPRTPYDEAAQSQLGERLDRAVEALPKRERDVIFLHYRQHYPFVRIAEALNVSKGRVSQLHKQALNRLREVLAGERWHQSF